MSRIVKITAVDDSLVFGASGALGSGFVRMLREGKKNAIEKKFLTKSYELSAKLETIILRDLQQNFQISKVFYFSGYSDPKTITHSTSEEELQSLRVSLNLVNKLYGVRIFTYASSVLASLPEEYISSLRDSRFLTPLILYSETKRTAESVICENLTNRSIRFIILNRYTNLFGEYPFGSTSLLSYVLKSIRDGDRAIYLNSPKASLFNLVYDFEVHLRLKEFITGLNVVETPSVVLNYIAESDSKSLGDLLTQITLETNSSEIEIVYGKMPTFWDFFERPQQLISPGVTENFLALKRLCKNFISRNEN